MTDEQLIDIVARLWIACGGDAEGIVWCWQRIKERIEEILEENNEQ